MATKQYICILKSHSSPYLFQEFICSHSSVPHFTPSYNEIVTSIYVIFTWGTIVENQQWNWFVASHTIRQRKQIRCKPYTLAAKTGLLQAAHFNNKCYFAAADTLSTTNANFNAGNSISAANRTSIANNTTLTANVDSLETTQLWQQMLIHYSQHTFSSECEFAADNTI